jgi:hypothetical protein
MKPSKTTIDPSCKKIKNKTEKIATNKKENQLNLETHWNTVINHHAAYDEIIEEIKQCPVEDSLEITLSKKILEKQ